MVDEMTQKPSRRETWFRVLFVLLFAVIYSVAEIVIVTVVLLQFGFVLITGERNKKLLDFGANLSTFVYQILRYVSFNTDERPFPFTDWPSVTGEIGNNPSSDAP